MATVMRLPIPLGPARPSYHLRQVRTDRGAWIAIAAPLLAGAVGRDISGEGKQLFISPVARDQVGEPILTRPPALWALDPQHVELADKIAEGNRAVAGHCELVIYDQ